MIHSTPESLSRSLIPQPAKIGKSEFLLRSLNLRSILQKRAIATGLSFLVPFLIRAVPQLIVWPSPLGYDVVAVYAPFIALVRQNGFAFEAAHIIDAPMAPLIFLILGTTGIALPVSAFTIAAFTAPVLYGTLGLSLFTFIRGRFHWPSRDSLFAVLLTTLYLLPLRYSWDSLKDLLGLAAFFAALARLPSDQHPRSWSMFAILATISVLTEEVEAVLVSALAAYMFVRSFKGNRRQWKPWLTTFVTCTLLVILYSHLLIPSGPSPFPPYGPLPKQPPLGNYLVSGLSPYQYYVNLSIGATLLIVLGLAPIIFPVLKGYFRERVLSGLLLLLSLATLSVYLPGLTVNIWPTWLLLLSFPLLLYAYQGFRKINRGLTGLLLAFILLTSTGFIVLTPQNALPYLTSEHTRPYIPTSLMQNTIPLDRVRSVENCVWWLNAKVGPEDVLVVSNAFYGYVQVEGKPMPIYTFYNVKEIDWSSFRDKQMIYSISWSDQSNWYVGGELPPMFHVVFSSDNVGVFRADPRSFILIDASNH